MLELKLIAISTILKMKTILLTSVSEAKNFHRPIHRGLIELINIVLKRQEKMILRKLIKRKTMLSFHTL